MHKVQDKQEMKKARRDIFFSDGSIASLFSTGERYSGRSSPRVACPSGGELFSHRINQESIKVERFNELNQYRSSVYRDSPTKSTKREIRQQQKKEVYA